jgi:hypothetical protein
VGAAPAAAVSSEGYEIWRDCSALPDDFEFLPVHVNSDLQTFVDLGRSVAARGAMWRALQYTRDKDLGTVPVAVDRWYGGMGAERWPLGTVNPLQQFQAFRVTAWEVDGNRHSIDPSCVLTLETDELQLGLYNVWVRFTEPGVHTLRIFGRQLADFYFIFPFQALGGADPFGLLGRRVFLRGEYVGDMLDGEFVHSYELDASYVNSHVN